MEPINEKRKDKEDKGGKMNKNEAKRKFYQQMLQSNNWNKDEYFERTVNKLRWHLEQLKQEGRPDKLLVNWMEHEVRIIKDLSVIWEEL